MYAPSGGGFFLSVIFALSVAHLCKAYLLQFALESIQPVEYLCLKLVLLAAIGDQLSRRNRERKEGQKIARAEQ